MRKLGDGSSSDDGAYVLLKEAIDNSVDEFIMGHGREIRIDIDDEGRVEVRDFGRGIPLGKLYDCAAQINIPLCSFARAQSSRTWSNSPMVSDLQCWKLHLRLPVESGVLFAAAGSA